MYRTARVHFRNSRIIFDLLQGICWNVMVFSSKLLFFYFLDLGGISFLTIRFFCETREIKMQISNNAGTMSNFIYKLVLHKKSPVEWSLKLRLYVSWNSDFASIKWWLSKKGNFTEKRRASAIDSNRMFKVLPVS